MSAKDLALKIVIGVQDTASGALRALTGQVAQLGLAIATYFGAQAAANFFTDIVQQAGDLQRQLSILQQVTGALPADLDALRAAAEGVAQSGIGFSARDAAAAEIELGKAGQTTQQILAALKPTLDMAAAAQLGVSDSAAIMTRTLAAFGLGAQHATDVANTLVAGANASNTSVQGLAEALSYAGPMAQAAGLSLQQVVAATGAMANQGIDASRAGTALNSILSSIQDPASTASRALMAMGVTTTDLNGVIAALSQKTPQAERAILAFGMEAGPGLRALIATGTAGLTDLEGQITSNGTAAEDAAAAIRKNLLGAFDALGSMWQTLKTRLGDGLLGPLEREVRSFVETLKGWMGSGQLEQLRDTLVTLFESAAGAVRQFLKDFDLSSSIAGLKAWAADSRATFDGWAQNLATVGDVFGRIGAGFSVVFDGIRTAAASVGYGLAKLVQGTLYAQLQIDKLGLASQEATAKAQAAYDEAKAAADSWGESMREEADKTGASWEKMTRGTTQAAHQGQQAVAAAAKEQTAAVSEAAKAQTAAVDASFKQMDQARSDSVAAMQQAIDDANAGGATAYANVAESISKMGQAQRDAGAAISDTIIKTQAGAQAAADGSEKAVALAESLKEMAVAHHDATAAVQTWNSTTQQWVTVTEQATATTNTSADAKEREAAKIAANTQRLAEESRARAIVIKALDEDLERRGREVDLIEREGQARISHIENLRAEALARGDGLEVMRLDTELQDANASALSRVRDAKVAAAQAAADYAAKLREQLTAEGETAAVTTKSVVAAEQSAQAKKLEAAAAQEAYRHEVALREATEATAAATQRSAQAAGQDADARERGSAAEKDKAAQVKADEAYRNRTITTDFEQVFKQYGTDFAAFGKANYNKNNPAYGPQMQQAYFEWLQAQGAFGDHTKSPTTAAERFAAGNQKAAIQPATQPVRTVQVNLTLGGKTTKVNVLEGQENDLLDAIRRAGLAA